MKRTFTALVVIALSLVMMTSEPFAQETNPEVPETHYLMLRTDTDQILFFVGATAGDVQDKAVEVLTVAFPDMDVYEGARWYLPTIEPPANTVWWLQDVEAASVDRTVELLWPNGS